MGQRLAGMIEQVASERGWSLREIARRSGLPPATVQKASNPDSPSVPRRETLEALARGLNVPTTMLLTAAIDDYGVTPAVDPDDPSVSLVVHAMQELTPQRRAELASLARAMLDNQRRIEH